MTDLRNDLIIRDRMIHKFTSILTSQEHYIEEVRNKILNKEYENLDKMAVISTLLGGGIVAHSIVSHFEVSTKDED